MAIEQDISKEVSQVDLDAVSLHLTQHTDFNRNFGIADQALWPEESDKTSPKVLKLNERIDWCIAHELSGTWWFIASLYRWWYEIEIQDTQRYLLGVLKKLHDGKIAYSTILPGEKALLSIFQSRSLAPLFVYMKSTFMGAIGFSALCQLITMVWSVFSDVHTAKETASTRGLDMKKFQALSTSLSQREAMTAEQVDLSERIKNLKKEIDIFQPLDDKDTNYVSNFFSGTTPDFCVWQQKYFQLNKEIEKLYACDLNGVYVDREAAVKVLNEIKIRMERMQRYSLVLAEDYLEKSLNEKHNELKDVYVQAQTCQHIDINEYLRDSDKIIRKCNIDAMRIGVEGIFSLNQIRRKNVTLLKNWQREYQSKLEALKDIPPAERAELIAKNSSAVNSKRKKNKSVPVLEGGRRESSNSSFDESNITVFQKFKLDCKRIAEQLMVVEEQESDDFKIIMILNMAAQLLNAVDNQAKIVDPGCTRLTQRLFPWLSNNYERNNQAKLQAAADEAKDEFDNLFKKLDDNFISVLNRVRFTLVSSMNDEMRVSQNVIENTFRFIKEKLKCLDVLAPTILVGVDNGDRRLARAIFETYRSRLIVLETEATQCKQKLFEKQLLSAIQKAEEVGREALISLINAKESEPDETDNVFKTYQKSVEEAVQRSASQFEGLSDIVARVQECETVFNQMCEHVKGWFKTQKSLKFFQGTKDEFEKKRKALSLKYHPDSASRQGWSKENVQVAGAIFKKLKEWETEKGAEYSPAKDVPEKPMMSPWDIKNDSLSSWKEYVNLLKIHTMKDLNLWAMKTYREYLDDQTLKPLKDEHDRLRECVVSPNNDAILLYEAEPQYPKDDDHRITMDFQTGLSILEKAVKCPGKKFFDIEVILSDADKEDLIDFIQSEQAEAAHLRTELKNGLKNKDKIISREKERYETEIQGWRNALYVFEKREKNNDEILILMNEFEKHLVSLESAVNIVPEYSPYGNGTASRERFSGGVSKRYQCIRRRFGRVIETLPNESNVSFFNWELVAKRLSENNMLLFSAIEKQLKEIEYIPLYTASELRELAISQMRKADGKNLEHYCSLYKESDQELSFEEFLTKAEQGEIEGGAAMVLALSDALNICIELYEPDGTCVKYGEESGKTVRLLEESSARYIQLIPIEKLVSQVVKAKNSAENIKAAKDAHIENEKLSLEERKTSYDHAIPDQEDPFLLSENNSPCNFRFTNAASNSASESKVIFCGYRDGQPSGNNHTVNYKPGTL